MNLGKSALHGSVPAEAHACEPDMATLVFAHCGLWRTSTPETSLAAFRLSHVMRTRAPRSRGSRKFDAGDSPAAAAASQPPDAERGAVVRVLRVQNQALSRTAVTTIPASMEAMERWTQQQAGADVGGRPRSWSPSVSLTGRGGVACVAVHRGGGIVMDWAMEQTALITRQGIDETFGTSVARPRGWRTKKHHQFGDLYVVA